MKTNKIRLNDVRVSFTDDELTTLRKVSTKFGLKPTYFIKMITTSRINQELKEEN